jgi:phospholipid transport system substrate-binding protein
MYIVSGIVRGLVLGLSLLAVDIAPASAQVAPDKASNFIQQLGTRALTLVEAQQQGITREGPGLGDLVRDNFDLDQMGRLTLGSALQSATPEQVSEYQSLFARWMANSYVMFLPTHRVEFRVVGVHPLGIADALVDSVIDRRGRPPLTATWRVEEEAGGQMKISDVLFDGVSLLKIKQEEFASAVRRGGLSGLLGELKRVVANLEADVARGGIGASRGVAP